jgi:hypothetical protein
MGLAGLIGLQGLQGESGATGTPGTIGLQGVQGETGATGSPGAVGLQGPDGPQGLVGASGVTGQTGATGPAGASGPAGTNGLAEYAYVYNVGPETVEAGADISFDTNGVSALTPGITHTPGTSQITLLNAGIYKVAFSVSTVEPSQMALFVNGSLVPGTVYGSGAGTQQNNGQAIVGVAAGGILTVRSYTSAAAVILQTLAGGTQTNVNASVVIEKLG